MTERRVWSFPLPSYKVERVAPDAVFAPGALVCESFCEACRCARERGHEGNHHCECGGQWVGSDGTGDAVPKKLPDSAGPFGSLLDGLFGDPD